MILLTYSYYQMFSDVYYMTFSILINRSALPLRASSIVNLSNGLPIGPEVHVVFRPVSSGETSNRGGGIGLEI